ncbi:MAG: SDR family NAD(P)-dependent oxidoreductase [Acidimicrobiales bacterium]
MDLGLDQKHALVTGGSRGIGRAVVERLLAEGMRVSFCARTPEGVAAAVDELAELGEVEGAAVDVSDHAALAAWADGAIDRAGGVDVVVPNASALGGIPDDAAGWQRSFEVDVLPAILLVEAALPSLRPRGGSVVQLGTITAVEYHHYPGGGKSYGPVKAALINWIAQLAKEEASNGVRANAVSPGPIEIEGGSWDRIKRGKPDYYAANLARQPQGRFGTAAEVANLVAFLASPAASWITGQNHVIDGGFTLRIGY